MTRWGIAIIAAGLLVAAFVGSREEAPKRAVAAAAGPAVQGASRGDDARVDEVAQVAPAKRRAEGRKSALETAPDPVAAQEAWDDVQRRERCRRFVPPGDTRVGHDLQPDEAEQAILAELCKGLVEDSRVLAAQLKRAAELGSAEARWLYASNPALRIEHMSAEFEAWHDWRERAPRYLEEAISRGEGKAAMLYGIASMRRECNLDEGIHLQSIEGAICPRGFPLNAILRRDDVVAYAHLLLARELGVGDHASELERVMVDLASHMTNEQRAQAEQVLQTLRAGVCCRS